jgi:hypothetical protein
MKEKGGNRRKSRKTDDKEAEQGIDMMTMLTISTINRSRDVLPHDQHMFVVTACPFRRRHAIRRPDASSSFSSLLSFPQYFPCVGLNCRHHNSSFRRCLVLLLFLLLVLLLLFLLFRAHCVLFTTPPLHPRPAPPPTVLHVNVDRVDDDNVTVVMTRKLQYCTCYKEEQGQQQEEEEEETGEASVREDKEKEEEQEENAK